jgi:hypothetical protein
MTIKELLLSDKDYSSFSKEELEAQHEIIMEQYDKFKSEITSDVNSRTIPVNIVNIKNIQMRTQQNMFSNMLKEVDTHLRIIEDLIKSK